jgi:hypothetical protein
MKTMIARIGDAMAAPKHRASFTQITQTTSEVIPPEQGAKRTLCEMGGQEEWKQRIEEDWQGHFERLQQCVCELLLKNQQLRMALMVADKPEHGYRGAINL